MNFLVRNIPNCITSLNLLGGVSACVCAAMYAATGETWVLTLAYCFIGLSAVADFFDGFCARMLGAYSELGKQLDSLSDLVSFGVAPGLLVFFTFMQASLPVWTWWTALLIPLCGAWRLGRFNIESAGDTSFKGLPIPANAIFWIGYTAQVAEQGARGWCAALVVICISWFMVSSLRMLAFKFHSYSIASLWPAILLLVLAVVLCAWLGVTGLMWIVLFYIILSQFLLDSKLRR